MIDLGIEGKKIVLFGTGSVALLFHGLFAEKCRILCFCDNNTSNQGKKIKGKPVIDPKNITEYEFDYVLIASSFDLEIYDQLVNQLAIKPRQISVVPIDLLRVMAKKQKFRRYTIISIILVVIAWYLKR